MDASLDFGGIMSEAADLAEETAEAAWVQFDRRKYDHDEMLIVVRENSRQSSEQISDLRSEVRSLETKLVGLGTTLNYTLWISGLLLGAAAFSQTGLFK